MARRPALSPSRASDFRQCPLMFRLRTIDKVPEPPSAAATLGTLVHAVLEDLFDLPAAERTEQAALAAVAPRWERMLERNPALAELHEDDAALAVWLEDARSRLRTYFTMENPTRLQPSGKEEFVELQLPDGPLLRGIIDRVETAPDGSIRLSDYKTGKTPHPRYGTKERFQMKFYALLVERLRGTRPALLQLLFLKDGGTLMLRPTAEDLANVEAEIRDLWVEISACAREARFVAKPSKLCDWCNFRELCPQFGGTPPALEPEKAMKALGLT
ncbi:RecB family exonuclease [Demequina zhanjiangensis]|uniref:PD-(D/E)XK nuclease family protein n=1 Tax=Demequina zhanjiangensis TaxID=3051659 RepID=A0ABT8G2F6_9MICO|nr:PD-(D/E)XK nuclease family protein [Demequina sp. SYSU T00b26]MDN4473124.1 PD-(D/E)XK nuclease family protein [Demequina sp. SYSU T00b26]